MTKKRGPKIDKKFGSVKKYPPVISTAPLYVDIRKLEQPIQRAELVIQGLDMSDFSYEGRIFLNNVRATQETPLSLQNGYVGSFHIFGWGNAFDLGMKESYHTRDTYDYRPSLPLSLQHKRVIVTNALKILGQKTNKFVITIVPVLPGNSNLLDTHIIRFNKIGIMIR